MMTPKERFNLASQSFHDELQRLLTESGAPLVTQVAALTSQLAQQKAAYDQLQSEHETLLSDMSAFFEGAKTKLTTLFQGEAHNADPSTMQTSA
jgi:peptidoglycan hydrolase CwlO-like protein